VVGTDRRRCRSGLEAVKARLQHELLDGQTYWFSESKPSEKFDSPTAFLLSVYDEYISGYKDHSAIVDAKHGAKLIAMGNALNYVVVVGGQIVGTWKRTLSKDAVLIEANLFRPLTQPEKRAVASAADLYGRFVGLPVKLRDSGA
jgi:YHS domain-containing protein